MRLSLAVRKAGTKFFLDENNDQSCKPLMKDALLRFVAIYAFLPDNTRNYSFTFSIPKGLKHS